MSEKTEEKLRKRLQNEIAVSTILRTPASNALASIVQLQSDLVTTFSTIDAASLGPFQLQGQCDYDCILGVCFKTSGWTCSLDFSDIRPPLQNAVAGVGDSASSFNVAFAPARVWLKSTLPQFSTDFTMQSNVIIATNTAVVQAGGVATAQQIADVQAAFSDIAQGLKNGQSQMSGAISTSAQFVLNLTMIEGALAPLLTNIQQSMDASVNNLENNFISGMDCGQDDANNQITGAVSTFNASVATIQSSFNTLTNDTNAVESATSQFVATLVNILDQYQNIAQQVSIAGNYPAGAIQDLHLDIAANEWTQLAQYAEANIQ